MNIRKEQTDELNAVLKVKVEEDDYREKVEKVLKDYKKQARIDGFRPGMVPMGMIKKMYYKPALVDEVNRLVSDKLMNYIQDEKLQILGEPLPHKDSDKTIDFDNDKEFEFSFDIGIAPEFEVEISEKDKIPFYNIKIDNKVIDEYVDNIAKKFGEFKAVEKADKDELIKGKLYEAGQNEEAEDGRIIVEEASMSLDMMKDDEQKKLFKGAAAGDSITFDIKKAYPNEAELSAMLNIERDKISEIPEQFTMEIKEILEFEKHEVNQDLFDKTYGEGNVKSEKEFRDKIKEEISQNYERDSNYRFGIDAKDFLLEKFSPDLPVDFLKRWLMEANEGMTGEKIDQEFDNYEKEFKWQLIKNKIIDKYEVQVNQEELKEFAMNLSRNQFYQYGLYNMPDEQIEQFAMEQLSKPEEARRLQDQKFEEKIISLVKEKVKLDKKEISQDKFRKLFE